MARSPKDKKRVVIQSDGVEVLADIDGPEVGSEIDSINNDGKTVEVEAVEPEVLPVDYEVEEELVAEPASISSSKDLVRYDPLEAYLREIKAYPHLSKEEEVKLAQRYQKSQDVQAAFKLVTSNLWIVVKIARDYERAAKSILDLIQEGNIGLMEAVKNFDPYRGVRFPSYAVWWIKAYIVRYLIANWRMVKLGTTQAQRKLFFNLKKEQEKLEREGFFPAPKLLAERLNVKEAEVLEMQQRLEGADVSVDAPLASSDSEANLLSILPASQDSAEDILDRKRRAELFKTSIDEFVSGLSHKDQVIFKSRLLSEDKVTLHEVSEELGLSKERIRQLENNLKSKFKKFLEEKFGDEVEVFSS